MLATAALVLTSCSGLAQNAGDTLPRDQNVLFWSQDQRDAAFRQMEKLATTNAIPAGDAVFPLTDGAPLDLGNIDIDDYMRNQRSAGLIVLHDGKVRFEKYALGYDAAGRWTSFSVAKSLTSTLVGAAVKDGYIKRLDDKVTQYIPGLKGSAYDDVSVVQLLTMTSGVKWNEDYTDPKSDVALFNLHKAAAGEDVTVSYMKRLPREAPAGQSGCIKPARPI